MKIIILHGRNFKYKLFLRMIIDQKQIASYQIDYTYQHCPWTFEKKVYRDGHQIKTLLLPQQGRQPSLI